jgi:hypothetical protein
MKIYNCHRELEKSKRTFEELLAELQKLNNSILTDLSELYNRGWKDEHYTNLKAVLTERSGELNALIQHLSGIIEEINQRLAIIKNYYSVAL